MMMFANVEVPGTAKIIDGRVPHWSEPFEGERISIVAFLHDGTKALQRSEQIYLRSLGFELNIKPDVHKTDSAIRRRIVEFCCGQESRIGKLAPPDCEVIRLTIDDDLTTREGLEKAIAAVSVDGLPTLLMGSLPCVGGSPYQYMNWKLGHLRGAKSAIIVLYSAYYGTIL